MSKAAKISIIAGVVVVFIILLYFFGGASKEKDKTTFVIDDWDMTYDPYDRGPYGTFVLKELLDTARLFGNFIEMNKKLEKALKDSAGINDIYFFVGEENYMDYESVNYLQEFVLNGNTVFMSANAFPDDFIDDFTFDPDSLFLYPYHEDSSQHFKFTHPSLQSKRYSSTFVYNNRTDTLTWNYFNPLNFDVYGDDTIYCLGTNTKDKWNFIKVKYGEGYVFLHSTPYLFTNISLMKRSGFEYAENIFSHIPPGRIQWDRYNLETHYEQYNNDGDGDDTGGDEERRSILQFILDNPPLAWALFVLLVGALFYAIFKGRRMQRIIPPAESKENTSLAYISTVSSLYLQENQHIKLVRLKERTFLNFIADHYYITTKKVDAKFIDKVAIKSQIDREKIVELFRLFETLQSSAIVTDDELIRLHQKIEYFYKKCR